MSSSEESTREVLESTSTNFNTAGLVIVQPAPTAPPTTGLQHRPSLRFRPQCTHLTMTRLYGYEFICDNCRRPGSFGWVFRCTQDREDVIEHAIDAGKHTTFDDFGKDVTNRMGERKRGPKARQHELSFFDEVTSEQLASYRPDQLKAILRQRQQVHQSATKDIDAALLRNKFKENGGGLMDGNPLERGSEGRPWLRNHTRPCEYTVCPRCRPGAVDRTYLSLDGVANGDIPPTAAVGYGFHAIGFRPVVDAGILRTIGDAEIMERRLAWIQDQSKSSSSATSILAMLDNQIAQANAMIERQSEEIDGEILPPDQALKKPGQLKHSPRVENLAAFTIPGVVHDQGCSIRPPWTPPPSPSPYGRKSAKEVHSVGLAAEKSISNGRSSKSLKTNHKVRSQLLTSVPSTNARHKLAQSGSTENIPYLDEPEYDVGLTLPFNEKTFAKACGTPLATPDRDEEMYFYEHKSPMMQHEEEEGKFRPEPLVVEDGVAVLEESVELGVPDVVTQI